MATSAFTAGIPWIDPTGENTLVIRFVLGVVEDTPLHPEGSFAIASFAVLAFGGFQVAKVFKNENASFVLLCELNNASAHQMGYLRVYIADLAPQICIVLFIFGNDASLAAVACNTA